MTREKAIEILKQRECCRECVADCSCDECENAFDMAIKALEQEPTTKNDLGVDCISRADAIKAMQNKAKERQKYFAYLDGVADGLNESRNDVSEVLDKIRAEIEQLRLHKAQFITSDNKVCIDSQAVLDIIDKYKAETEVDDGNVD